ncbi:MAG: hypothetical protein K2H16_07235 [Prevotella sp.]|nr:hypothetical protein [Prevotella sp.]
MTLDKINAINIDVCNIYNSLNDTASNCALELADLAYPDHDGAPNANVVGDMMILRTNLNNLLEICRIMADKLTDVIGDNK